jgi:hypothetical protein
MDVRLTSGIQYSHILWEARMRAGFKMCSGIDITNNRRVMVIPLPKQSFAIKKENVEIIRNKRDLKERLFT